MAILLKKKIRKPTDPPTGTSDTTKTPSKEKLMVKYRGELKPQPEPYNTAASNFAASNKLNTKISDSGKARLLKMQEESDANKRKQKEILKLKQQSN